MTAIYRNVIRHRNYGSIPVNIIGCPHCQAERGERCHLPDGTTYHPPHRRRRRALAILVRVVDAIEDAT